MPRRINPGSHPSSNGGNPAAKPWSRRDFQEEMEKIRNRYRGRRGWQKDGVFLKREITEQEHTFINRGTAVLKKRVGWVNLDFTLWVQTDLIRGQEPWFQVRGDFNDSMEIEPLKTIRRELLRNHLAFALGEEQFFDPDGFIRPASHEKTQDLRLLSVSLERVLSFGTLLIKEPIKLLLMKAQIARTFLGKMVKEAEVGALMNQNLENPHPASLSERDEFLRALIYYNPESA